MARQGEQKQHEPPADDEMSYDEDPLYGFPRDSRGVSIAPTIDSSRQYGTAPIYTEQQRTMTSTPINRTPSAASTTTASESDGEESQDDPSDQTELQMLIDNATPRSHNTVPRLDMEFFANKKPTPPVLATTEYRSAHRFTFGIQTQRRPCIPSNESDVILQFNAQAVRGRGPLSIDAHATAEVVKAVSHDISTPVYGILDVPSDIQNMAYKVDIRYIKTADGFAGVVAGTESWLYRLCGAVFAARKRDPLHTYTRPVVPHIGAWYTVLNLVAVHEWLVRVVHATAESYNCTLAWTTPDTANATSQPVAVRTLGTPLLVFRGRLVSRDDILELFMRLCTHAALRVRAPDLVTERMLVGRHEDHMRLVVKLLAMS